MLFQLFPNSAHSDQQSLSETSSRGIGLHPMYGMEKSYTGTVASKKWKIMESWTSVGTAAARKTSRTRVWDPSCCGFWVRLWELGHSSRLSTERDSAVNLLLSSSSLVSTNEHLLQELSRTRAQHRAEVEQMHWSFQEFKKTTALFPRHSSHLGGRQSC